MDRDYILEDVIKRAKVLNERFCDESPYYLDKYEIHEIVKLFGILVEEVEYFQDIQRNLQSTVSYIEALEEENTALKLLLSQKGK